MKWAVVVGLLFSLSAFAAKKPHIEKMDFILEVGATESTYLATGEGDSLKLKLLEGTGKLTSATSGVFQWYFPEVTLDIADTLKSLPDSSDQRLTLSRRGERVFLKTETREKEELETNLLEVRFIEGNWDAFEKGEEIAVALTEASKKIAHELRVAGYRKMVSALQQQFQKGLHDVLVAKGLTKAGQELFTVGKMEVDYASPTGNSIYRGTNLRIVETAPAQVFRAHFPLETSLENATALLLTAALLSE